MAPRALVVEDDPSLREVATMVLERAGFAVRELDRFAFAPQPLIPRITHILGRAVRV